MSPAPLPSRRPSPTPTPVVRRVATALSVTVVAAVAAAACGTAGSSPASGGARTVAAATQTTAGPTGGSRLATARAAVATFRDDLGNASSAFVADVGRLQGDLQAGDVVAARRDELAAQAQFDQFRQLAGGDPINASAVDELATQVAPGQSFGGLHAVERDLWATPGGGVVQALADASGLEAQAPVTEYLLSKDAPAPEVIGTLAVDDLNWLDEQAVTEDQETFSHLDAVDIAAAAGAAGTAYAAIAPLADRVAPTLSATVAGRIRAVLADVAALGPPTLTPDADLPAAGLMALSRQADAAAAGLAQLSALLEPYGTGGGGDP